MSNATPRGGPPEPAPTPAPTVARVSGISARLALIYSLIFIISLADAMTPAGVVIGLLLGVPILLASMFVERRHVLAAGLASILCFLVAAEMGVEAISPRSVWVPNRVFALISIFAFTWIATELQRRREALERAYAQAESARDLARLLQSLMAHDLRAPLVLARQGFEMVRGAGEANWPPNLALVDEVDARLSRSLRTIELVLDAARTELREPLGTTAPAPVRVAAELEEEIAGFRTHAETRCKTLELQVNPPGMVLRLNVPVLRQGIAILVDNALRYALPGPVRILAETHGSMLWVHVSDAGPGLRGGETTGQGSGIGLRLCRLLATRAGGSLELVREGADGTEFVLRLPAAPL